MVPIAVFVFGYLVSWWILRKVSSARFLHGALIGMVATAMYLCSPEGSPRRRGQFRFRRV